MSKSLHRGFLSNRAIWSKRKWFESKCEMILLPNRAALALIQIFLAQRCEKLTASHHQLASCYHSRQENLTMVSGWYSLVFNGIWWYWMVLDGIGWYRIVLDGIGWYWMVFSPWCQGGSSRVWWASSWRGGWSRGGWPAGASRPSPPPSPKIGMILVMSVSSVSVWSVWTFSLYSDHKRKWFFSLF